MLSTNRRLDFFRRDQQPFSFTGLEEYWKRYDPIHIVSPLRHLQMRDGAWAISGAAPAFNLPTTQTTSGRFGSTRLYNDQGTILWSGSLPLEYQWPIAHVGIDGTSDDCSIEGNTAWNGTLRFLVRTSSVDRFAYNDSISVLNGGNALLSGGPAGTYAYVNGSLRNSSSSTFWANSFSTTTGRVVAVNTGNRGASATSTYPYGIVVFFARQISQPDAADLTRNPYLLFRPEVTPVHRVFSLPSASSGAFKPNFARNANSVIGASFHA